MRRITKLFEKSAPKNMNHSLNKFLHDSIQKQKISTIIQNFHSTSSNSNFNIPNNIKVKIVEVGPRDGLQNEINIPSTETKLTFIQKLVDAGCTHIETASFVSPKKVPAMADSFQLMHQLNKWRRSNECNSNNSNNVRFSVLIPNMKGFSNAIQLGGDAIDEIAIFASASETFSQKNIDCSIQESLSRYQDVIDKAKEYNIPIRGYISCVLGCPYENEIDPSKVAQLSETLIQLGCHEISLGDTIGVGTPEKTVQLLRLVKSVVDANKIAVHFHDTYGQALANIYASIGEGIRIIDSSVAGLGGCPYARGATGNVATEDVVYMLNGMGIESGINLDKLIDAGAFICDALGKETNSKCAQAIQGKRG